MTNDKQQAYSACHSQPPIHPSTFFKHPDESTLDRIGRACNTDKSSVNRKKGRDGKDLPGHDYLRKYEFFLSRFRDYPDLKVLELGAGPLWNMGASVRMWQKYFPVLELHVADIKSQAVSLAECSTIVHIGDLGEKEFLGELSRHTYHFILDDASHGWMHQVTCFNCLFHALAHGGIYIIEDIQTSFGQMRERYHQGFKIDAFSYFSALSCAVSGKGRKHPMTQSQLPSSAKEEIAAIWRSVDMVAFINHSCIVIKS